MCSRSWIDRSVSLAQTPCVIVLTNLVPIGVKRQQANVDTKATLTVTDHLYLLGPSIRLFQNERCPGLAQLLPDRIWKNSWLHIWRCKLCHNVYDVIYLCLHACMHTYIPRYLDTYINTLQLKRASISLLEDYEKLWNIIIRQYFGSLQLWQLCPWLFTAIRGVEDGSWTLLRCVAINAVPMNFWFCVEHVAVHLTMDLQGNCVVTSCDIHRQGPKV